MNITDPKLFSVFSVYFQVCSLFGEQLDYKVKEDIEYGEDEEAAEYPGLEISLNNKSYLIFEDEGYSYVILEVGGKKECFHDQEHIFEAAMELHLLLKQL